MIFKLNKFLVLLIFFLASLNLLSEESLKPKNEYSLVINEIIQILDRNHFKKNIKTGVTTVNLPTAGLDYHVPFGGRKASSFGPREQGTYAHEFFTQVKTTYVNPGKIK